MRDETLIKILLQGILPKFKAELYLRMPEDSNDFEALCKQLVISVQILQNKESSEDKELTAVIAGITHHEKQQDNELNQQKLEIGNLKQKIAELETYSKKRHSSQEHLATVAAVDHYDPRRTSSLDRHQRKDPRVQFSRPSSSQSRDSSFLRQQGPNSSYSRSRDQSPAYHRDSHNNKRSYSNNQPRFQGNDRNRRPNNSRYNHKRYPNQNNKNNFKWPNSSHQDQSGPQGQQPPTRRNITCYNYGKQGHIARECWTDMARTNRAYKNN
jgi:hypothetical protein